MSNFPENPRDLARVDGARIELLRDFVSEQLLLAIHRGELAASFASIADDAGMTYALKGAVGHFKLAVGAANDIAAIKNGGAV
jgi:hypothetical protein